MPGIILESLALRPLRRRRLAAAVHRTAAVPGSPVRRPLADLDDAFVVALAGF